MRLRRRTQEREVNRMKRGAARRFRLEHHKVLRRTPGMGDQMRGSLLWRVAALVPVVAIWLVEPGGLLWAFTIGLAIGLVLINFARSTSFRNGSRYIDAMHLEVEIDRMNTICERMEKELAPHHPEREAAHAFRAELVKRRAGMSA